MDSIATLLGYYVIAACLGCIMYGCSCSFAQWREERRKPQTFVARSEDGSLRFLMFYSHSDKGRYQRMQHSISQHSYSLN